LSTWIFRIARNLHIDRKRREPQWVALEDEADHSGELEDTISSSPERLAEQAQLESRLDQLSTVQGRVIRMSYFEAKTHSEIAHELGMPLGTVKSHLRRAFLQLQRGIQDDR
jgi:RNA polymerase sigma factor (sigma-70 family)